MMLLELMPKPAIIAHRGASAQAPENTLAAFNLAIQQGCDAIELDAKLSSDQHVVVIHDQSVDRTTDGSGQVGKAPLAAIRNLDAGSSFDISFKGEKIPTLEEVFETIGRRTLINIELTNYATPADNLPYLVSRLVLKHNLVGRVWFSSFNPLALLRARRILPVVPIGLLALPGRKGFLARSWLNKLAPHNALHPESGDVDEHLVNKVHSQGQQIYVYTVNQPEDMRRLFLLQVDGLFTDEPGLARRVLHDVLSGNAGKKAGSRNDP